MADNQDQNQDNQDNQNSSNEDQDSNSNQSADSKDTDMIQKLVEERVAEALKDIKGKLDKAYGSRDEALKKLAIIEDEKKAAELKRLQEEGKHKEAYELQLAEERAKREALEKRNIELTRDIEIRDALKSYVFRNDNATEMAYREIVAQVVQNEQGIWVHRSGVSIKDFVKSFADSDENSFLFKAKSSNGSGSQSTKPSDSSDSSNKSLFAMSQDDVLKLAREGKLRR